MTDLAFPSIDALPKWVRKDLRDEAELAFPGVEWHDGQFEEGSCNG